MPVAYSMSAQALITNAAGTALCENCCPEGDCPCCAVGPGIATTVYVRLVGVLDFVNPCAATCLAAAQLCYELVQTGPCVWQGTGLVHATCMPISALTLTLTCNANSVTMTLVWQLSATDSATFRKVIPGSPTINCNNCLVYELDELVDNATTCDGLNAIPEVTFNKSAKCCQYCSDSLSLHFLNFSFADGTGKCTQQNCIDAFNNDVYVLDRIATYTNPLDNVCGVAHDGAWCQYSTPLAIRCTDSRYGWCELHAFLRTNADCSLDLLVYLRYDDDPASNACLANSFQAWRKLGLTQDCENIDVTLGFGDICVDTSWLCASAGGSIRIQSA